MPSLRLAGAFVLIVQICTINDRNHFNSQIARYNWYVIKLTHLLDSFMSISDPLIGKRLGDYLIESVLGTGGMARVYRGYDDNLDRYAAIKVIEPQLIASAEEDEYRERFLREARAIARLNHPNIVGIYQFNQVGNLYYIAMEYVGGENLRDILKAYIRQDKLMPTEELLSVLVDIGEALDYAHSQRIIHRDIKPSNIIVQADGRAVLTDFGLALNAMEGTIGNTFGSVHYIAPEQAISSAQAVPQSDQYSLGIVAYELLTGRVPFDDASAMSVALKHISDPPPPPTELNPNIPVEVERVLMRVLDKEVDKRFSTSSDFVRSLKDAFRVVDNVDVAPPPQGLPTVTSTQSSGRVTSGSKATVVPPNQSSNKLPAAQPLMSTTSMQLPQQQGINFGLLVGGVALTLLVLVAIVLFLNGALDGVLGYTSATETAVAEVALIDLQDRQTEQAIVNEQATQDSISTSDAETASALATEHARGTADVIASAEAQANLSLTQTEVSVLSLATEEETEEPVIEPSETELTVNSSPTTERATSSPSATVIPTMTYTPSPTQTPSNTPRPTRTPTPEILLPTNVEDTEELPQVLLRYDGRNFIMGNRDSTETLDVSDIVFVLFEPDEKTGEFSATERFDMSTTSFNNLARNMNSSRCFQILDGSQFAGQPQDIPLAEDLCSRFSSPFWLTTVETFWISSANDAYLEVRLGPVDVLATCPTNRRFTRVEIRCVVDVSLFD